MTRSITLSTLVLSLAFLAGPVSAGPGAPGHSHEHAAFSAGEPGNPKKPARTVTVGSRDTVTLALSALPVVNFAGTVRSSVGGAPLDASSVSLAYTPIHEHTGPDGLFAVDVPEGLYRLEVRCAGFVPLEYDRQIGPAFPGQDFSLTPAPYWDNLEVDQGWASSAPGDNANASGRWTRAAATWRSGSERAAASSPGR